jgi:hypothetical protein
MESDSIEKRGGGWGGLMLTPSTLGGCQHVLVRSVLTTRWGFNVLMILTPTANHWHDHW